MVTKALVERKILVEYGIGRVSDEIRRIWFSHAEMAESTDKERGRYGLAGESERESESGSKP